MSPIKNIAIIGAGLVGSLLSIILAKRGYSIQVFEKKADFLAQKNAEGRSINLALSDRGWKALKKGNLEKTLQREVIPMHGRQIHAHDGKQHFQAYGKDGQFISSIMRLQLNQLLIKEAISKKVKFNFSSEIKNLDLDDSSFYIGATCHQFDLIIGTDGINSIIRNEIESKTSSSSTLLPLGHSYKEITFESSEAHHLQKNALHIWPRGDFMLIALPNPNNTFTGTLFMPNEGKVSFKTLNKSTINSFFEREFPDALQLLPNLESAFEQTPIGRLATLDCPTWKYKNTFIMGDAAHAIVPFYGQGMNAGFEDCSILDELLDKFPILEAFNQFSANRKIDSDAIAKLAIDNYEEMRSSVANPLFLKRKEFEKYLNTNAPNQWIPAYSQVTFSHIPYSQAQKNTIEQSILVNSAMERFSPFDHDKFDQAAAWVLQNIDKKEISYT